MPDFSVEFGVNAAWVSEMFERWSGDPRGVPEDWSDYFARIAPDRAATHAPAAANGTHPSAEAAPSSDAAPRAAAAPAAVPEDAEPLRGVAGKIVKNMEESLGVPTATSVRTIGVRLLEENRNLLNRHLAFANRGKASFTHLVAYAMVRALREMPRLNAAFSRQEEQAYRLRRGAINFGVAVDLDGARSRRRGPRRPPSRRVLLRHVVLPGT
jgi:2-oxoglutarate decarboxylase